MDILTIQHKTDEPLSFILTRQEAIQLELKLNVSKKGLEWKKIGDILFEFGSNRQMKIYENYSNGIITCTDEEFTFLGILNGKNTWEECKDI